MPKLEISYNAGVDVLYISIGEPRPGIAAECNDGDFIRLDPATNEVVGITLLDFRERFIQAPPGNICSKCGNYLFKALPHSGSWSVPICQCIPENRNDNS